MDGVFKLFNALIRVKKRIGLQMALQSMFKFTNMMRKHNFEYKQ